MTPLLWIVVKLAVITWACLLAASLLCARGWTPEGMKFAMGNRERMPEPSPLAGRAERMARNTLENFVLFAVIALVAHGAGQATPGVLRGAEVFFWARLIYIPVYVAGVPYLRTGVWAVAIAGLAMMIAALA
jgi:uncharacterized MAPEG superfamily protein